ncbi:MAG: hypothetical protein ABL897_05495, partial [Hyphomicrobium sp.]
MAITPPFNTAFGALNADVDKVQFALWANAVESAINAFVESTPPYANTALATMPAGTIKANVTGGVATPTDVTLTDFKTFLALSTANITGLGALAVLGEAANTNLAEMPNETVKANLSGSTSIPADVAFADFVAALPAFAQDVKGVVPPPDAAELAALKFLRADGTWQVLAGSGAV